ncbi:DUF4843 domain-containing protein [Belliella marina]|uniref:DUF4843 domain-containing protein n=1 Tax=Belliella marina TaxID=1644146 RepID=A0ABW4VUY0_9BACT
MKKLTIHIKFAILFLLLASSCVEEQLMTYSEKDAVYFRRSVFGTNTNLATDSLFYSLGLTRPDLIDSVITVEIGLTGNATDYDRPVNLQLINGTTATADLHYRMLEPAVLKAGEFIARIPISLIKSEAIASDTVSLVMQLLPNEHFDVNMNELINSSGVTVRKHDIFSIYVTGAVSRPQFWFDPYLGTFSVKKLMLISEVMNVNPIMFLSPPQLAEVMYIGVFMKRYLLLQKELGNTIYEEDGSEMIMGSAI